MKAIVQHRYGPPDDVLDLKEIEKPVAKDDEVLVQVHATAIGGGYWHLMRGLPYIARMGVGLLKPRSPVPGSDVAGRVEAVGANVTRFRAGDDVYGWCDGAFAEYVAVSPDTLAPKPSTLTYGQAASVPDCALTALGALRDAGKLESGQKVLILGASGGIGTFAVQIAKAFGAEVTGVCSTGNVDLVRSTGADHVIDYTQEDFTESGQRHDLMVDIVGNRSLSDCRRVLTPKGTLVFVASLGRSRLEGADRWFMGTQRWIRAMVLSPFVGQKLRPFVQSATQADLVALTELIEAGKITPVISAEYPLREVREAIRHFGAGHGRGKVVLRVTRNGA